ncbi:nitrate/nitrite transporter NrtS [Vibrio brasiliensis]|jgi:hypothetical protein|uniref:nitrate/nitrite transporter NrtS n=1 Tax=Vibrio brasiliensis TaxID=170652 RepID=UPI001EFD23B4|nr:nitrate/nitrite transporter NrtS [Vibrio brasiliensis]MCG9752225.1 nitrate/nitrite transporter NrtS [Vibrio brasiliensis]MCG9784070.1 nitrate/nitrite transporter NrtS [Vibrio brasiliensis]
MTRIDSIKRYCRYAYRHGIFHRSIKVSVVVGSVLMLINHGDKLVLQSFETTDYLKIGLTYLVPFCVSTHASLQAAFEYNKEGTRHD